MCGLAGMAGDFRLDDHKFFKSLLHISGLRGLDGTGVYSNDTKSKEDEGFLKKRAIGPEAFLREDRVCALRDAVLDDHRANLFIGHCRDSTVGAVNQNNTHPFEFSNIVGAHNGTLVDAKYRFGRGKTDSEAMFEAMNETSIKEVVQDLSPYSAWAISVYDKRKRTITLGRNLGDKKNGMRPLFLGFNKLRPVLYWASEELFLYTAAKRNNIEIEVVDLTPDYLFEIDISKIAAGNETPWVSTDHVPTKKQFYSQPSKKSANSNNSARDAATTFFQDLNDPIPFDAYSMGSAVMEGEMSVEEFQNMSGAGNPELWKESSLETERFFWEKTCSSCGDPVSQVSIDCGDTSEIQMSGGGLVHTCLSCRIAINEHKRHMLRIQEEKDDKDKNAVSVQ